jgi:2,3-bisphosphoglycerate-dependent phosphoglycerate mutase
MIGFTVKYYWYQIGREDFLHSFFSTVCYNLEDGRWGSRYPVLMNELYQGRLEYEHINDAIAELDSFTGEFKKLPPEKAVWDIEDLSKQPPQWYKCNPDAADLSDYFLNSDGDDFLMLFKHALEMGVKVKLPVEISTL